MLPKKNRLKKTKDISEAFRKGKGYREGPLFLKLRKNNLKESRFAFVISKEVSRRASQRNRFKRIVREAVRRRLPGLEEKGFDGIFVILAEPKETEATIDKLLKKAKL